MSIMKKIPLLSAFVLSIAIVYSSMSFAGGNDSNTAAHTPIMDPDQMTTYPAAIQGVSPAPVPANGIPDPLEPMNRAIFKFNDVVDHIVLDPVARMYNAILPDFIRDAIQSFMRNLQSPLIVANNILQGDIGGAGVATARFVVNSTVGVLGLVDVASTHGLAYEDEDFGQTLAVWGFGDGFYLVLPILGPSSLRDTAGLGADALADPVRIVAENNDNEWVYYTRGIVKGIDTRSRMLKGLDDLRANSLDYYAAIRSAYGQKRASLIRDEKGGAASVSIPDYDE